MSARLLLLLCTLCAAFALRAAPSIALASGVPANFTVPAGAFTTSFYVDVADSDQFLRIDLDSASAGVDVDLYARYGSPFPDTFDGVRPIDPAYINELGQYRSVSSGNDEWFVITRSSGQPLRAGRWYILAINFGAVDAQSSLLATRSANPPPAASFSVDFTGAGSSPGDCSVAEWNDSTSLSSAGGNSGNRGQQRRNAMLNAASQLATQLQSPVPITIQACWDDLGGDANGATLARAGPRFAFRNDDLPDLVQSGGQTFQIPNKHAYLPRNYTWYAGTAAQRLAGTTLCRLVGGPCERTDIRVTFNNQVDGPTALGARKFYYGLDSGTTQDSDFVTVAMHEITHGLGFLSFVQVGDDPDSGDVSGAEFGGYDDIYSANVAWLVGTQLRPFTLLSDAERSSAMSNAPNLRWTGESASNSPFNSRATNSPPDNLVRLFAPFELNPGSTLSHLDSLGNFLEMMTAVNTRPQHDMRLGRAILDGVGWSTAAVPAPIDTKPLGGVYFDPRHDGHGIEFWPANPEADLWAAIFFSFDQNGDAEWFLTAGRFVDGLFQPQTDPDGHSLQRFVYVNGRSQVDPSFNGQLRLDFNQPRHAPACAAAQGVGGHMAVMTFTLGNDPIQQWCMQEIVPASIRPGNDRTGSWYAGEQDSGWGFTLAGIPGATPDDGGLFALLYYFDGQGKPRWALTSINDLQPGVQAPLVNRLGYCRTCPIPPGYPAGRDTTIGSMTLDLNSAGAPGSTVDFVANWPGAEGGSFARDNSPLVILSVPADQQTPR
ncbi:MAG: hypothetical protein AB7F83_07815 [Lysobacterales bacterium]